jgi:uncharacterized protein YndB with AHSA1/START domain
MSDEVTREVLVPAEPEEVWRALTEPDGLAGWFAEDAELELEPGGELRLRLSDGEERQGFFDQIEPPRRLGFWWSREDGESTRIEFTLEPCEAGTLVRVEESRPLAILDCRGIDLAVELGVRPSSPEMLAAV